MEKQKAREPHIPKIKICGITSIKEADYLNENQVDYAGFVFYENSKRNLSIPEAIIIKKSLYPQIKTVAVTVNPTLEQVQSIERAGFDILQVHKGISLEVLKDCRIPIWKAFNLGGEKQVSEALETQEEKIERQQLEQQKIEAYLLDGAEFGSGKIFDWGSKELVCQVEEQLKDKILILAGGLTTENVKRGVKRFRPDIVDVSSGVEGTKGKDPEKIKTFVRKVRTDETNR